VISRLQSMLLFFVLAAPLIAGSCESLASLSLADANITTARIVPAGTFVPPNGGRPDAYKGLPDYCRVSATLTPSSDSDI
jgi:feruloyl esterase